MQKSYTKALHLSVLDAVCSQKTGWCCMVTSSLARSLSSKALQGYTLQNASFPHDYALG